MAGAEPYALRDMTAPDYRLVLVPKKLADLSVELIQSFLTAGRYNPGNAYANHVEQVPRVSITSPIAGT